MIGNLVEYVGGFGDFFGKRGIVMRVDEARHCNAPICYEVCWTPPVNFGGRMVRKSTFIHQDLRIVSEVPDES